MAVELDIQGGPVGPSHAHANIFTISTDSKGRALVNHGVALITCNLFFGFTFKWALPLFNNTNDSILYAVIHMEPEYFLIFVGLLPLLLSYVWYMYVLFCAWLMILIMHQGVTTDLEIIWNNVSAPSFGLTNKSEWIHVASKCFSVFLKSWFRKKKIPKHYDYGHFCDVFKVLIALICLCEDPLVSALYFLSFPSISLFLFHCQSIPICKLLFSLFAFSEAGEVEKPK